MIYKASYSFLIKPHLFLLHHCMQIKSMDGYTVSRSMYYFSFLAERGRMQKAILAEKISLQNCSICPMFLDTCMDSTGKEMRGKIKWPHSLAETWLIAWSIANINTYLWKKSCLPSHNPLSATKMASCRDRHWRERDQWNQRRRWILVKSPPWTKQQYTICKLWGT